MSIQISNFKVLRFKSWLRRPVNFEIYYNFPHSFR